MWIPNDGTFLTFFNSVFNATSRIQRDVPPASGEAHKAIDRFLPGDVWIRGVAGGLQATNHAGWIARPPDQPILTRRVTTNRDE